MPAGVRTKLLMIYEIGRWAMTWAPSVGGRLRDTASLFRYASEFPSRKERIPMNIPQMVERWKEAVVGLTLSHDKSTLDRWEHAIEDLLTPILGAPVKQLRQFYKQLVAALQADPRIPFIIWRMFEVWQTQMIDNAPDEGVIALKKKLAEEITALVEKDVLPQIPDAIIAALQWRPPETLAKVKEALEGGAKPKLVGKESCLFLSVGDEIIQL